MSGFHSVWAPAWLALMTTVLAGCGGGGGSSAAGSSSGGGGSGGVAEQADVSEGLPADVAGFIVPGTSDSLFFTQALEAPARSGLFSVYPGGTLEISQVDAQLGEHFFSDTDAVPPTFATITESNYERSLFSFYEADAAVSGGGLENLRVAELFYADGGLMPSMSNGYRRVTVDDSGTAPAPVAVSNATTSPNFMGSLLIINDLNQAESSCLLDEVTGWRQICLDDGAATSPISLPSGMQAFSPVSDISGFSGLGYLVIDENANDALRMVNIADLQPRTGNVDYAGSGNDVVGVTLATDMLIRSAQGQNYLALSFEEDADPQIWLYEVYHPAKPGRITPVLSAEGEPLVVGRTLFPPYVAARPEDRHITVMNGETFFLRSLVSDPLVTDLIRLDGAQWSVVDSFDSTGLFGSVTNAFLMSAGDRLVVEVHGEVFSLAADGSDRTLLDASTDDMFGQFVTAPVLGSADGWVFYNRYEGADDDPFAVALNPGTGQRHDIPDWQWVGASATGTATAGMRHAGKSLSEVFMIGPGAELAAVQAATPMAGKVNFGTLPNGATDVEFFGVAPGPDRLARSISLAPDDTELYEVLYLDVRDENSLQVVTDAPSTNGVQRPLPNF